VVLIFAPSRFFVACILSILARLTRVSLFVIASWKMIPLYPDKFCSSYQMHIILGYWATWIPLLQGKGWGSTFGIVSWSPPPSICTKLVY
jgi:hypothetical protein